ncbi:MAG: XRE family transcriptional regulator [bacterium]|nr:XRE family transcriptional regulator [bacterium]
MGTKIGELIKIKRESKGMSQRQLALYAEISNTEVSRIESGIRANPSALVLKRIAKVLNISIEEIFRTAGYLPQEELPDKQEPFDKTKHPEYLPVKWIPVVGHIHADKLHETIDNPEDRIPIPPDMSADYALIVKDDSMKPYYKEGDRVLVRECPEAYNGQHVVARIGDELAVKVFYKYDHTVVLRSTNPTYEDISDKNVRVVGVVKGAITKR